MYSLWKSVFISLHVPFHTGCVGGDPVISSYRDVIELVSRKMAYGSLPGLLCCRSICISSHRSQFAETETRLLRSKQADPPSSISREMISIVDVTFFEVVFVPPHSCMVSCEICQRIKTCLPWYTTQRSLTAWKRRDHSHCNVTALHHNTVRQQNWGEILKVLHVAWL